MTKENKTLTCKLLVIGAGPGGYVAAIRAGQLGIDTIVVEGSRAGGTCLIRGCIPSKALIHAAGRFEELSEHFEDEKFGIALPAKPSIDFKKTIEWKESIVDRLNTGVEALLKKAKVNLVTGWATFRDGKTCDVETADGLVSITAEHVLLANGSHSVELPFMPFSDDVLSSTQALELDHIPQKMTVIGGGYIGLELGIAYQKFGSQVTIIEAQDCLLPTYDRELVSPVEKKVKELGIEVVLNARAKGYENKSLTYTDSTGEDITLDADKVLVTVGRKPNLEGWGLSNMAVDLEEQNGTQFIKVDQQCKTSMRNVWAIGDITGEPMLAHRASAQGEMVAELIAGHKRAFDPVAIAAVCFTDPEIVGVGLSQADAKEQAIDTVVGKFPLMANGRALTMEAGEGGGFIRVTARKDNHVIIGIHAVGPHVSEMSGEFALAIEMGARLEDIEGTIHVHPTMTEAFHEAALKALGHAIHI